MDTNNQFIEEKITQIVREVLETNDEINKQLELSELGMDSLASINLIVELEDAFDIVFNDNELLFENFSTIENIIKQIEKLQKNKINN
ncbi:MULTISPECIES: acyl carrier protein [Bacillus]|uniref:acyl carrier protein n=1 Tax=Bacillus TaxID=1386 RepID=UPI000696F475|nr:MULTISPECIES: phosphopantetheine-binding protein [Bacillus]